MFLEGFIEININTMKVEINTSLLLLKYQKSDMKELQNDN